MHTEAVLLPFYAAQISVNELAVGAEPSTSNADILRRLEALRACLRGLEDWFQVWSRVPPARRIGLTFAVFIQLIHAIAALFRLSTADNIPAWNPAEVKNHLDLLMLLDRTADELSLSSSALSIIEDDPGEESSELIPEKSRCVFPSFWGSPRPLWLWSGRTTLPGHI